MHMKELYGSRLSRKEAYQLYLSAGTVEEFEYLPSPLTETEQALYAICNTYKEKMVQKARAYEQAAAGTHADNPEAQEGPEVAAGSQC